MAGIKVSCAPGQGAEKHKLRVTVQADGHRGGVAALPWQVAAWLGRCLMDPETWIPRGESTVLTVALKGDDAQTVVAMISFRVWFQLPTRVRTKGPDGITDIIANPARMIGEHILNAAKLVGEVEDANAVIDSQAVLLNRGIPMEITKNPAIFAEAVKEAQFAPELRKAVGGTSGLASLNGRKAFIGLPSAMQFAPGTPQHEIDLARIASGSMSKAQRDAHRAALDQQEKAE